MNIEKRQKVLVILTLAVVGLLIADKVVLTPLSNWWDKRDQEVRKLRKDIADGKALKNRGTSLRNQWNDMRKNTLPDNSSLAPEKVLKALEDWAQESGASLNAQTPQWKSGDSDEYRTLICRIDASGTIWTLSRFLYDVEKGPMGLKVESMDLRSRDNTGQQLTLGMQVSGLVLTPTAKPQ